MSTQKKITIWLIASSLLTFIIIPAQSQELTFDLKKAVHHALKNNLTLRSDSLNMVITDLNNKELAGLYLPQVNYSSNSEYNPKIASQLMPGALLGDPSKDLVPIQMGTRYNIKTGVELTQAIYKKDLLIQMRAAGLNSNIAQTRSKLTTEQLVYQVAYSFFALQATADLIRATTEDYTNLKEVLAIAEAQYEFGVIKRIDFQSLQINVSNKESYLSQLQTQFLNQQAAFNYLLGLPAETRFSLIDSSELSFTVPDTQKKIAGRNDLTLSHQLIESKQVEIKKIRAEKAPSVSSYFRYNYQSQFNDAGKMFNNDYWYNGSTIGVAVSIPIFDGNRRKNRIKVAQVQLDQLKYQNSLQFQKAEVEYLTASDVLKNNLGQAMVNDKNLQLAQQVFNSRKALYNEGITSLVELLDAESELTQARHLYLQSQSNVKTGWLDLHKANGTLLTDFLKTI
jgi:outer membrane protein TolC